MLKNAQHFLNCSCLYRDFVEIPFKASLSIMESALEIVCIILIKVMEIHWSKCVRTLLLA